MKKRSRTSIILASGAMTFLGLAASANAATLFSSGTKTWDTVTANWGTTTTGPYATATWNNGTPDSAVFEGTAGTVTLGTNINIENLTISLPSAAGSGYFIGSAAEDNTLNFSGTKLVTVTATGNGTNQDVTIRAGITGAPTMNIAGRNTNSVNSFTLAPEGSVTQTIGTLNMLNTLASNKRLILGGTSNGNVVDTVTWAVTANQLMLTKAGTGSWTINNDFAGSGRAARLYVEQGELTLLGTSNFFTHKVGVATTRESNLIASNLASKLNVEGTFTINDSREYFFVQNNGTIAPGQGGSDVASLTVRWNTNSTQATGTADFRIQSGGIYEWDILSNLPGGTDVINVLTGGSDDARLILDAGAILKINDAGVGAPIAFTDQLTVFTYEFGAQTVTRNLGAVIFDTSALGAGWTVGTLALTDDNAGRIFLTGLSKTTAVAVPEPATATLAALGLAGLMLRRRRTT